VNVPLLDTTRGQESLFDELSAVCDRVIRSGRYILGPEVEGLEQELSAYVGAQHGIGVSSGSDALLIALNAFDVGPGDEVVCPTFTFFATAAAISRLGAKPVFCDCDPDTLNARASDIEACLTPATKVILPVHMFGRCLDFAPIAELASAHALPVVEDAAQAVGTKGAAGSAGSLGSAACFSFYPTKNLAAFGDGGFVTTNDAEVDDKVRVLRALGMRQRYYHEVVGWNFRLDALQAALLRVKLRRLDEANATRRDNAARYGELFGAHDLDAVGLPSEDPGCTWHQYVVRIRDGRRDALREHLAAQGIGTEIYYPVPLHMQECFADLGYREGAFPHSEQASREVLALPIFPGLREEEIAAVVDAIAGFLA
jgi:dTDP-4-amino-4,6-dideoxygalactose transaminase